MTQRVERQRFLACLSDPSRFSLVTTLLEGPRCVTELATMVGLSQSCTTRHLQILERAGIVAGERRGKRVLFGLESALRDDHPVLRWVLESETATGVEPGRAGRTRTRRSASPVEPSPAGRPRAIRSDESLVESVEVLSTMPLVHEAGWVEDVPPTAEESAGEGADEASAPVRRSSMDDFLL
jgi:ArsR family transcriptional regulator